MCVNNSVKSSVHQIPVDDHYYYSEIDKNKTSFKYDDTDDYNFYDSKPVFKKRQSPLTVTEIDLQNLTEPHQILGSFNAG